MRSLFQRRIQRLCAFLVILTGIAPLRAAEFRDMFSDRETVVKRFRQVAEYMKDFAAWAKKQSDAILDDLVRHG
jgi:hypothetical protein